MSHSLTRALVVFSCVFFSPPFSAHRGAEIIRGTVTVMEDAFHTQAIWNVRYVKAPSHLHHSLTACDRHVARTSSRPPMVLASDVDIKCY
ncbi:hypothetical protein F4604DRAFT_258475 [Suillus subluteus]|nr:hypothetical protein F4604DRAFT_258475 [Suillus subluteus]